MSESNLRTRWRKCAFALLLLSGLLGQADQGHAQESEVFQPSELLDITPGNTHVLFLRNLGGASAGPETLTVVNDVTVATIEIAPDAINGEFSGYIINAISSTGTTPSPDTTFGGLLFTVGSTGTSVEVMLAPSLILTLGGSDTGTLKVTTTLQVGLENPSVSSAASQPQNVVVFTLEIRPQNTNFHRVAFGDSQPSIVIEEVEGVPGGTNTIDPRRADYNRMEQWCRDSGGTVIRYESVGGTSGDGGLNADNLRSRCTAMAATTAPVLSMCEYKESGNPAIPAFPAGVDTLLPVAKDRCVIEYQVPDVQERGFFRTDRDAENVPYWSGYLSVNRPYYTGRPIDLDPLNPAFLSHVLNIGSCPAGETGTLLPVPYPGPCVSVIAQECIGDSERRDSDTGVNNDNPFGSCLNPFIIGQTVTTINPDRTFGPMTVATAIVGAPVMLEQDDKGIAPTIWTDSDGMTIDATTYFETVPSLMLVVTNTMSSTKTELVLSQGRYNEGTSLVPLTLKVALSDATRGTPVEVLVGSVTVNTLANTPPTYDTAQVLLEPPPPPLYEDGSSTPHPGRTATVNVFNVVMAVTDSNGDTLTVRLENSRSYNLGQGVSTLFDTEPMLILAGSPGSPQDIVLQGGVVAANANGVWTATVVLSDEIAPEITVGVVTVSVTAVNDVPTYTAGSLSITVAEDTTGAIPPAPLTVATGISDIDNTIGDMTVSLANRSSNEGSLFSTAPTASLNTGTSVIVLQGGTLNANANGVWTATVRLIDGDASTAATVAVGIMTVNVTAVNDEPTYTAATLSTIVAEDTAGAIPPAPMTVATGVSDVDDGDVLTVLLEGRSSNEGSLFSTVPTVSLNTGTSVIVLQGGTLNANANGRWTATVRLGDGSTVVNVGEVTVNVTAANDEPTYTLGALSVTVAEDAAGAIPPAPLIVATDISDMDNAIGGLTVSLANPSSNEGSLFSTAPTVSLNTGTSVIVLQGGTLNANANGVWTATVHLSDGVAVVNAGVVTVSVTAVNDAPTFTPGTLSTMVAEDTTGTIPPTSLTVATGVDDVDNTIGDLTVSLADPSSNEGSLFSTAPTVSLNTGTSVIVLQGGTLNANANGVWTATVRLSDGDASTAATATVGVVTVSVTVVNDAPTYTPGTLSVNVAEDTTGAIPPTPLTVATGVSDADGNALTVSLEGRSSNEGSLFSTAPAVSLNTGTSVIVLQGGTLNANANGVWTATVLLGDGITVVDTGIVTVNVTAVNDVPTYTVATITRRSTESDVAYTIPDWTVATELVDMDGDALRATLFSPSVVRSVTSQEDLRFTRPTATIEGNAIVLKNGTIGANFIGEWTATVRLNDGTATVDVSTVAVTVDPDTAVFHIVLPGESGELIEEPSPMSTRRALIGTVIDPRVRCRTGYDIDSCPDMGVDLTAYLETGDARCEPPGSSVTEPDYDTYSEGYCTPYRLASRQANGDISLTLNHGGVFSVRWAGRTPEHATLATRVAEYYVRPVLELGANFDVPASSGVVVPIAVGSYGPASPETSQEVTLSVAVSPSGMEHTVSATIAYPHETGTIMLPSMNLAEGDVLAVSLLGDSYANDDMAVYDIGRDTMTLTARAALNVRDFSATPELLHCGREVMNITSTATICPSGSEESGMTAYRFAVDIQQWLSVDSSTAQVVIDRGGSSMPVMATMHGATTRHVFDLDTADIASSPVLNISVAVTLSRSVLEGASQVAVLDSTMLTAQYPVVLDTPSDVQRNLFAGAGQALLPGRFARQVNRFILPTVSSDVIPEGVTRGPPEYIRGAPVVDFIAKLPHGMSHATIVLQYRDRDNNLLNFPAPNPRYYKYRSGGLNVWLPFVLADTTDYVYSAPGLPCPLPHPDVMNAGSPAWTSGLTSEHQCLLLAIEDNGENDDDDGTRGMVTDPGAVAPITPPSPTGLRILSQGGGGSSLNLWGLLALVLFAVSGTPRRRSFASRA